LQARELRRANSQEKDLRVREVAQRKLKKWLSNDPVMKGTCAGSLHRTLRSNLQTSDKHRETRDLEQEANRLKYQAAVAVLNQMARGPGRGR